MVNIYQLAVSSSIRLAEMLSFLLISKVKVSLSRTQSDRPFKNMSFEYQAQSKVTVFKVFLHVGEQQLVYLNSPHFQSFHW